MWGPANTGKGRGSVRETPVLRSRSKPPRPIERTGIGAVKSQIILFLSIFLDPFVQILAYSLKVSNPLEVYKIKYSNLTKPKTGVQKFLF